VRQCRHCRLQKTIRFGEGLIAGSKHLGRSWLNVTSNVYGHFDKTRRREAPAMAETLGI